MLDKKHILAIVLIIATGLISFSDSFKLALFGDDWLVLYIFKNQVLHGGVGFSPWDPRSYLSPYGPTYLLMGILSRFFGLNPLPYFVASFVFRSLAAIALYVFIFFLTRKRLSALAAGTFWAVSEIGIESTNWVFNMNSYIGLTLFLVTLIFYLKFHITAKRIFLLLTVVFLSLATISVPVRMHGAFIVLVAMEIFFFKSLKKFILLNLVWITTFVTISGWKVFGSGNFDIYVGKGIRENQVAVQSGKFDHLFLPLTTVGNLLFVDRFMNNVQIPRIIYKIQDLLWFKSFLIPLWLIISPVFAVLSFLVVDSKLRKRFVVLTTSLLFLFILLINFVVVRSSANSMSPNQMFLTVIGGSLIILITVLIPLAKQKSERMKLFLSLVWLGGFAAVPVVFTPLSYISSSMRYLVIPGVAIPIMVGLSLSLPKSALQKVLMLALVMPLYAIQYSSTQVYFQDLLSSRSEALSTAIWEKILTAVPPLDQEKDYVFYFEPAEEKGAIVRDVITFGFIPRMIVYGRAADRAGSLYVVEKPGEFVSAVTDGEKLKAYNWGKPKKINPKNSFAFRLEPDNTLTDIKSKILYGSR